MRRGGWRPEILEAVEAASAAKGGKFERRDIVHELAKKHPDVPNRRLQGAVVDHMTKGPGGRYEVRAKSRRWAPRRAVEAPVLPVNAESAPGSGDAATCPLSKRTVWLALTEDRPLGHYVFECSECGSTLIIGKPECPNRTCGGLVDWTGILTPDYLAEVLKGL